MVSTIIANVTVYQNFNVGSTRSVVATNALHQLQLTSKIVATVPKDGTIVLWGSHKISKFVYMINIAQIISTDLIP
jgi:hypothetical protein